MNEAVVIMLVNYFHDLATGLLFGAVAAYFIARKTASGRPDRDAFVRILHQRFKPVVLGALSLVILGGIPRAIFYEEYEWLPAAGRGQVAALVVKHVLLVSITALSVGFFLFKRPRGPKGLSGDAPKADND